MPQNFPIGALRAELVPSTSREYLPTVTIRAVNLCVQPKRDKQITTYIREEKQQTTVIYETFTVFLSRTAVQLLCRKGQHVMCITLAQVVTLSLSSKAAA